MTKRLYPVNLKLEGILHNYDADHLGHILCELIKDLDPCTEVLNIIKLEIETMSRENIQQFCKIIMDFLRQADIFNYIIIPLAYGLDDVKFDLIKVEEKSIIKEIFDRIQQDRGEWSQGFIDDKTFAQRLDNLESEYLERYK